MSNEIGIREDWLPTHSSPLRSISSGVLATGLTQVLGEDGREWRSERSLRYVDFQWSGQNPTGGQKRPDRAKR